MNAKTELKDWIPVISQLVYPLLGLMFLLIYKDEIHSFFDKKVMQGEAEEFSMKGLGFEIAIKQKAKQTTIKELGFTKLGLQTKAIADFDPGDSPYSSSRVKKETASRLIKVIRENRNKLAFETLVLESGKTFSVNLLNSYINLLGVRNIVFVNKDKFEGLIDAKLLINQYTNPSENLDYNSLKNSVGINNTALKDNNTVLEVLQVMNQKNLGEIAIVNSNNELVYIVQRESLIAKLVASIITEPSATDSLNQTANL